MNDPLVATFWDHLEELRRTLIRVILIIVSGIVLSFCFYKPLFALLVKPLEVQLVMLSPIEGFLTMVKLSFWSGFVCTSPLWLYTIMKFILPALKHREKMLALPFLLLSLFFAGGGALFAYFLTIPLANAYFQSFNAEIGQNLWTLQYYFDYTITLLLANALAFELSVLLLFLLHFGIVSVSFLKEKRAHAIVLIFILAAILTPPDVLTQLMLGIPMTIIYEGLIIYGTLISKGREFAHDRYDLVPLKEDAIHQQAK